MIVPEDSQYGGDTTITCDWGFNRNAKTVTFYRSPVELPMEELAKLELDSNGELIGDAKIGNRTKYGEGFQTERSFSLIIYDVLHDTAGPYWCTVAVPIPEMTPEEKHSETKRLNITRRCNQM